MTADLMMMLLADARLPVAGHTQSAGLEPALRGGLTAAEVPAYLRIRLRTVTLVEAGTAVVALHRLRAGLPLGPVEVAWAARTPSLVLRDTSRRLARGYLRLADRLWPDDRAFIQVQALPHPSRGLVLGAVAAASALAPLELARLIGYDDVQTVTSAALKLEPMDPATTTGWTLDAFTAIEQMALEVADLTDPAAIPAAGAPQIEQWAEAHARANRRLFSG